MINQEKQPTTENYSILQKPSQILMIDSKANISVNSRLSQKQAAVKSEPKINAVTGVKDWGL
jgi:hypothetical protein